MCHAGAMALDDRFSAERFRGLSLDDRASVARAIDDLQDAVLEELHPVIAEKFREIVGTLNGMGHRLVLDEELPGDITYHDPHEPPGRAHCWLRVGVDAIISAGWVGIWDEEEFDPDEEEP